MVARWFELAEQYNGLPLDDRNALEQMLAERPSGAPSRERYVYYPDCASVPEQSAVAIGGRSYTISVGVQVDSSAAEGVLFAQGGVAGGHSLFVQDGRLQLPLQLGRARTCRPSPRTARSSPARTSSRPSSWPRAAARTR